MHGRSTILRVLVAALVGAVSGPGGAAATPLFSLDSASPSLAGSLGPDDVLEGGPAVHTEGSSLGLADDLLGGDFDELDALSFGRDPIDATVFFSVDRLSLGLSGTPVHAAALPGVEEAHGDVFVSPPSGSNLLVTDEALLGLIAGFFGDELDALDLDPDGPLLYFSIDSLSASNGFGAGSLADDILLAGLGVYALGETHMALLAGDDIDALALDDRVNPGVLDPGIDRALFSLSRASPTVLGGGASAADVLFTDFTGSFLVHRSAAGLGLRAEDDVDALDTVPEPSSFLLLASGLGALAARSRARRMGRGGDA
jgi:hypothetical protein